MTVTIRPATQADAHAIQLRPSDLHEGNLWVPGWGVGAVLESTIENATQAYTAEAGGKVVAVFGFTVERSEVWPWLMCAPEARNHAKLMVRNAKALLSVIRRNFPDALICNHVHRPNAEARAFITYLGFRVLASPGNAEFDFFYLPPCA